jgi:hypothetical protein
MIGSDHVKSVEKQRYPSQILNQYAQTWNCCPSSIALRLTLASDSTSGPSSSSGPSNFSSGQILAQVH